MLILQDMLIAQYEVAVDHVRFLLEVELNSIPWTKNPSFKESAHKYRLERFAASASTVTVTTAHGEEKEIPSGGIDFNAAILPGPKGDIKYAFKKNILQPSSLLRDCARRRFVGTVCKQGTDFHQLHVKNSPLHLFSSLFVASPAP
jgi:hypothetical protein